jgi:hypothetical protein
VEYPKLNMEQEEVENILQGIKEKVFENVSFYKDIALCPCCGYRINIKNIKRKTIVCLGCKKKISLELLKKYAETRNLYCFKDDIERAFELNIGGGN